MAFGGEITTFSCRIGISDCNHLCNSLIFRPFLLNSRTLIVLHKYSISLILAITSRGLTNAHVPVTAHLMYVIAKEKKMSFSHSIVSDSEV